VGGYSLDLVGRDITNEAEAGVEASRRGGFGLVVGVARHGDSGARRDRGADLVVGDLGELPVELLTDAES